MLTRKAGTLSWRPADARTAFGFSLVELLIVLVIALSVVAIGTTVYSRAMSTAELKAAVDRLASDPRLARGLAIVQGRQIALVLDVPRRRYEIPGQRESYQFGKGISVEFSARELEARDDEVSKVRFYPDGASSGGSITVSDGKHGYLVNVEWLTGRVNVREAWR